MIKIITQDGTATYEIEYFHIEYNEETTMYDIIGRARFDLEQTALVVLGSYTFHRQALEVFATIDYNDNDLMYYRINQKELQLPEDITDPQECMRRYGVLY